MVLVKRGIFKISKIYLTNNNEICVVKISLKNNSFYIIVIYFDVQNNKKNLEIKNEIKKIYNVLKKEKVLLMGDFNAHLKEIDGRKNSNTKIFQDFIDETDFTVLNLLDICKGKYTRCSGNTKTAIDFALANTELLPCVCDIMIDEDKIIDISDHNLMHIKLKLCKESKGSLKKYVEYISTDNTLKNLEFSQFIENNINTIAENIENVEEILIRGIEKYLIRKKEIKPHSWVSVKLQKMIEERKRLNRMKRKEKDKIRHTELQKRYEIMKKKIQKQIIIEKNDIENKEATFIYQNTNVNKWKIINKLRGKEKKVTEIKEIFNKNGNMQEIKTALMDFWGEFLYDNQAKNINDITYRRHDTSMVNYIIEEHNYTKMEGIKEINWSISNEETITQIRKLKSNRAKDIVGIKGEVVKILINSENFLEKLTNSFNNILENNCIPESWRKSKLILIPKKDTDITVKDFRPITITNITYKIMSGIINEKIEKFIINNKILEEEQAGFMKKRRIEENLLFIQIDMERAWRRMNSRFYVFLDLEKAFDSVSRFHLLQLLSDLGICRKIIQFIKNVFEGESCETYVDSKYIGNLHKNKGIKQGCMMSPLLFNTIINEIIKGINFIWRVEVDDFNILAFADDCLLKGDTEVQVAAKIAEFKRIANIYGLKINEKKSKILVINNRTTKTHIQGIPIVEEEKYLGFEILCRRSNFLKIHKDHKLLNLRKFEHMIYALVANKVNKVLLSKSLWQNLALPTILYGLPVFDLNKGDIKRLNNVQMRIFKRALNVPKQTSNNYVIEECRIKTIEEIDQCSKLVFLRHCLINTTKLASAISLEWERKNKTLDKYRLAVNNLNLEFTNIEYTENIKSINHQLYVKIMRNEMNTNSCLQLYNFHHNFKRKPRTWRNNAKDKILAMLQSGVLKYYKLRCEICEINLDVNHIYECRQNPYANEIQNVEIDNILMFNDYDGNYDHILLWFYNTFVSKSVSPS